MLNESVAIIKDDQPKRGSAFMIKSTFEEKIGKTIFVVETKNLEKGKETVEEKLRNIMIKDLIAKDNTMAS